MRRSAFGNGMPVSSSLYSSRTVQAYSIQAQASTPLQFRLPK